MSDPFIAEIRIFAGNFAPRSWAFCNGTLLPIAQNTAVFAIIGTTFGGDGQATMGLPDLRGRAPMNPRHGPGLSSYSLGQNSGSDMETLSVNQIPSHNHIARGSENSAVTDDPENNYIARGGGRGANAYLNADTGIGPSKQLAATGNSQSHNNMQPYLALNFIFALQGTFPSPN